MRTKKLLLLLSVMFVSMSVWAQDIEGRTWKYYDEYDSMPGVEFILKFSTGSSMDVIWKVEGAFEANIGAIGYAIIPGTYTNNNNYLSVTVNNAKVSYKYECDLDGQQMSASCTKAYNKFKSNFRLLIRELQKSFGSRIRGKYWIDGGALQWQTKKNGIDTFYPNY